MAVKTLFFDSYAFFEILEGNPEYTKYTHGTAIVTSRLNLMELFYGLLVKYNKQTANKFYDEFVKFSIEIGDEVIKEAMIFKYLHKKRKLSYIDCIGYILSLKNSLVFLTGDIGFKNLKNVEFISN